VAACATLERHDLVHPVECGADARSLYAFAHDIVRRVVYADLSEPRRRLMHQRVAGALGGAAPPDDACAAEVAQHAELGRDLALAAHACVQAARHSLRLFASTEAEALARRGLRHAAALPEPEQTTLRLELFHVALAARRPDPLDATARQIESLAERALANGRLEHARLGFHMLSWLRWEGGAWAEAHRNILRAEQVSRGANEQEQVVAMAEAARCLVLVERDVPQAEALLLEAGARARHLGFDAFAVADGFGMLRLHQGQFEEAAAFFAHAHELAERADDHDGEFQALAHLTVVDLECGRHDAAATRADELLVIAERMRGGSEAPFARALAALARHGRGEPAARAQLEAALRELRDVDAKHRLAFTLSRAAEVDLTRGHADEAEARAAEALRAAAVLEAQSEMMLANVLLARAAAARNDQGTVGRLRDAITESPFRLLSARARQAAESLLTLPVHGAPASRPSRRSRWNASSPNASSTNRSRPTSWRP